MNQFAAELLAKRAGMERALVSKSRINLCHKMTAAETQERAAGVLNYGGLTSHNLQGLKFDW